MGDAVRNCKRNAVLEASSTVSTVSKKRRIAGLSSSNAKLESTRSCVDSPENAVSPVNSEDFARVNAGVLCSSVCTDQLPASCCSSNESCEVVRDSLKLMDLEAKSFETVDSTYINNKFSRETTPSSELCGDSDEMDSLAMKPSSANHRRSPPVAKTPPEEEIEEFFATAEKYEQKRFAEKYNYDIVKDMPLEGRYQWIRLKP
ncbi:Cyclin-dependent kinase inhibitor 7 [Morella rubra]|uniref:Cyclin-dependent kinase inhibitor n=1 Tax=Morella rubra TaxID=262757 RepID=A0A6A1V387_9ROSI|nr:Cyclin-dependent kinase inhibitor 7 [Morella rubra]